jgi:formylglycine-generating enzyme required for sulfatase activity
MGTASALNDAYEIAAPVKTFIPNDYGLYNMAGNVSEWVQDVYRPTSFQEFNEFQPLRGNVYTNYRRDADGNFMKDEYGVLIRDTVANYINFRDGDYQSRIDESEEWENEQNKSKSTIDMYAQGTGKSDPRISDNARVYKGGSWKDRTYWLSPGSRRYLDERKATNDLGFRCAMTHLGDSNSK